MYAVIAVIFLTVNSYVLGAFGWKFAHDPVAKYGFALVAGAVPWALAPHLHVMAAKNRMLRAMNHGGRWRWLAALRRSWRSLVGMIPFVVIYVLFVSYNVLGGTGATAFQRQELSDERKHAASSVARTEARRKALQAQLDGIPKHRPRDAVTPLLEATKLHRFWDRTQECTDVTAKASRNFCADVLSLKAELANGERADKVLAELKQLDEKLSENHGPTTAEDPQVAFLSNMTGMAPEHILFVLLLATPLILEAGALYWGKQALELLNVHLEMQPHHSMVQTYALAGQPIPLTPAALPSAATATAIDGHLSGEDAELQAAVYERFWADCCRPMAGGMLAATTAYGAYRSYCGRRENNVIPLSFSEFLKRASARVSNTSTVAGVVHLCGYVLAEPMGDA